MSGAIRTIKIVQQTNKTNVGSVIFLHGSGDIGPNFLEWINFLIGNLNFPHLKCIFPTAPLRYYTPSGGAPSNVWFDRYDITPDVPEHTETLDSINLEMKQLIDKEVESGIPLNKIIVGGFSMGGALALHTAYRNVPGLAGVFTMSSFLNNNSVVYESLKGNRDLTNVPLLMFHGDRDDLVKMEWGKRTFDNLIDLGVRGDFKIVKNAFHEMKKQEIKELIEWIKNIIPESG